MAHTIDQRAAQAGREGLLKAISLYSERHPKIWPQIVSNVFHDRQSYSEFLAVGDFGMAQPVDETRPVTFDDFHTPFTLQATVVKRGKGFEMSKESDYTDIYGLVAARGKKIARAMEKTIEQSVADLFNNGFTSANLWDSQTWFSTTHVQASGTGDNRTDIAFSVSALEGAWADMAATKSHRGDPDPRMGPFVLVVPPSLSIYAQRVVQSQLQAGTNANDKNIIGGYISGVITNPYLTSQTAWFQLDKEENGVFQLNRMPYRTEVDYDMNRDMVKFAAFREFMHGVLDWRGSWGSPGV